MPLRPTLAAVVAMSALMACGTLLANHQAGPRCLLAAGAVGAATAALLFWSAGLAAPLWAWALPIAALTAVSVGWALRRGKAD